MDKHYGEAFRPKPISLEQAHRAARFTPSRTRLSQAQEIMKTLPSTDVVIIGGGWTGLLMAKELGARTSLSIVVLERGGPRKRPTTSRAWTSWIISSACT